jgi:hypothetical protein
MNVRAETIKHSHKIHDRDHKFAVPDIWDIIGFLHAKLTATERAKSYTSSDITLFSLLKVRGIC